MLEELRKENKLLELQRRYEEATLKEDLTESQKEELLALYQKQIANLERTIATYEKVLETYKAQILVKRKMKNKK